MKIATYNVNGINGRLPVLLRWLAETSPEIVCLQELKAPQEKFPQAAIEAAGYEAIWQGQKSWNGVAILSRVGTPVETRCGLPDDPDPGQSRYIEAAVGGVLSRGSIYPTAIPGRGRNSTISSPGSIGCSAMRRHCSRSTRPSSLAGDVNVMPTDRDVYKPERWREDALFAPEVRQAYEELLSLGWTDALRTLHPDESIYTFWDYFRNAYARDAGLRIDHILLNDVASGRLREAKVDRHVRGWEKTSDHAPVWISISES